MNTQNNFSDSNTSVFNHPHWSIASGDYIPQTEETAPSLFQFRMAENTAYNSFLFTFSIGLTTVVVSLLMAF